MHITADDLSGTVYIPDTSALIENPDALDRLLMDGNIVVLLHKVIEELGRLQSSRSKSDGVRHAARLVTRKMLEYRRQDLIHHGVDRLLQHKAAPEEFNRTPSGGLLTWEPDGATIDAYPSESGDNHILGSAHRIAEVAKSNGLPHYQVVVISEDSNLLLKCDALGMAAENLRYGKVTLDNVDQIYQGLICGGIDEDSLQDFLESGAPGERSLSLNKINTNGPVEFLWNMGVVLASGEHTILGRVNADTGRVEDLKYAQYWDRKRKDYKPRPILGFTPRDPQWSFSSTPMSSSSSSTARPARARPG